MAPKTLVLDASVGVKWFSAIGETDIPAARALLLEHSNNNIRIIVPDLFFHEVSNALVHKSSISVDQLTAAISTLFDLDLSVFYTSSENLRAAIQLARSDRITEYDAFYVVTASQNHCPLVTANPKHQGKRDQLGCQVILLKEWQAPL